MPVILKICSNCAHKMRRVYVRDTAKRGNRFVPLGVWCDRCHTISPDPLTKELAPEGEYLEYAYNRADRRITYWVPKAGTPLSE